MKTTTVPRSVTPSLQPWAVTCRKIWFSFCYQVKETQDVQNYRET